MAEVRRYTPVRKKTEPEPRIQVALDYEQQIVAANMARSRPAAQLIYELMRAEDARGVERQESKPGAFVEQVLGRQPRSPDEALSLLLSQVPGLRLTPLKTLHRERNVFLAGYREALSEIRSAEAGRASVRWAKTGQVRAHDVMKQGGSPQRRAAELGRAETALREAADLAAFARKPNLEPAPDKMELAQLSAKGLIDWPQPRDWISE